MRNGGREAHTDPSSGTYNLDSDEARGQELQIIAASRKPFRHLSCKLNKRTNLEPESNRKILSKIVCVKFRDDIHNPEEMTGKIMAVKYQANARYRLSGLIRAKKNDKLTSHLSKWIRTGEKEKGEIEEDSCMILSQFYKERKGLLYHTGDGVVVFKRRDE